MTPFQFAMGTSADQFSVALPAKVSRAASNASQSDNSPGLLAASSTASPEAQGVAPVWAEAGMAGSSTAASSASATTAATASIGKRLNSGVIARLSFPAPITGVMTCQVPILALTGRWASTGRQYTPKAPAKTFAAAGRGHRMVKQRWKTSVRRG